MSTSILDVPTEVLLLIFSFLSKSDLLNLRLVNEEFMLIFRHTKVGSLCDPFFKFLSASKKLVKPTRMWNGDEWNKERKEPNYYSFFDSFSNLILQVKRTQIAKEKLSRKIWMIEYLNHFSKHPETRPTCEEQKFIKRSEIPMNERLFLTSKAKETEFRDRIVRRLTWKHFETFHYTEAIFLTQFSFPGLDVIGMMQMQSRKNQVTMHARFHDRDDQGYQIKDTDIVDSTYMKKTFSPREGDLELYVNKIWDPDSEKIIPPPGMQTVDKFLERIVSDYENVKKIMMSFTNLDTLNRVKEKLSLTHFSNQELMIILLILLSLFANEGSGNYYYY